MKTHAHFRSDKFPAYGNEEEEMNPGIWGRRLAEYLVLNLKERGVEAEEPIAEDWGYYIPIVNDTFPLAVCCGHQDGDDDEFICFTDPSTVTVRKWFKKIDTTVQLEGLTKALDVILLADPDITDLEWN